MPRGACAFVPGRATAPRCAAASHGAGLRAQGKFEHAVPYESVPVYYVPQMIGLMAVFQRDYTDMFSYTMANGSRLFRMEAQPAVWSRFQPVLAEYWHNHLEPALKLLANGASREELRAYRPVWDAKRAAEMKALCEQSAAAVQVTDIPPLTEEQLRRVGRKPPGEAK